MLLSIVIPLAIVFGLPSPALSLTNNDILLGNQTSIQLRLFPGSSTLKLFGHHHDDQLKSFKITYKLYQQNVLTEKQTLDTVKYSRLVLNHSFYQEQPDDGLVYDANEMVSFWTNTTHVQQTAFVIEINDGGFFSENIQQTIKLSGFIRPFENCETNGLRNITLLDKQQNIRGEIQLDYLIIRPISTFDPRANEYISIDKIKYTGHRGTGVGIRTDLPENFIENTISAFNYVCSKGAQMIELDVQLSSDLIPIIYHDFEIKTYIFNRHNSQKNETILIPTKDVSHEKMQQISTHFMPFVKENATFEDQSFETLEQVLTNLKPGCGIDVEIKYPSQLKDLTYESQLGVELNEYVDRILQVLYKYGGDRPMFITSFQPDLCTMIQLKQNKYSVGFLTSAYEWARDPRLNSIEMGTLFAESMHFKGIVPDVKALLTSTPGQFKYIDFIKHQHHLGLYLWGSKINNQTIIKNLLKNGVDMVIFDHIDKIMNNEMILEA